MEWDNHVIGWVALRSWSQNVWNVWLLDENDNRVWVQAPLPTDWDSLYSKDINTTLSSTWGFSWAITDLFDSVSTTITDATATNPKELTIVLKRPMDSWAIKICTDTWDFSNVTIILKDASWTVKATIDDSANNTKYTSKEYVTTPTWFCTMVVQFHTADAVTLGFMLVFKAIHTHSQLMALKPDWTSTFIDATNWWNLKMSLEELESWISVNSNSQLRVTRYSSAWVEVCLLSDDPQLAVAYWSKPLLSKTSAVNKFWNAPDFDTWDGEITIWDGAEDWAAFELMNYVYSTTADIDSISSGNAWDTQDIEVQGLDTNWDLVVQTITLTWQTRAALTTSLKRVFRAKNVWSVDLIWHVVVYKNWTLSWWIPVTNADIRAVIHPENNQTEMAIYTIPTWKTWYIRRIYANSSWWSRTTKYITRIKARPDWQVFQLKYKGAFDDDAQLEKPYEVLLWPFTAMTDIEMTTEITAAWVTAANVIWGFDILLVDD